MRHGSAKPILAWTAALLVSVAGFNVSRVVEESFALIVFGTGGSCRCLHFLVAILAHITVQPLLRLLMSELRPQI